MFYIRCCFLLCSLQTTIAQYCELSKFNHESSFDDHVHFGEFLLVTSPVETFLDCTRECHGNSLCTVFTFNSGFCVLYGDVLYRGTTGRQYSPSLRYFFYTAAVCPLEKKFTMFRSSNMCIRLLTETRTYAAGKQKCENIGGRPSVLEEEIKAKAVLDILPIIGMDDEFIFIGGTREGSGNDFVWADGQPMVRDWWTDAEPNNLGDSQACAALASSGLYDVDCAWEKPLLCEFPL